jgi:hypothetical protein
MLITFLSRSVICCSMAARAQGSGTTARGEFRSSIGKLRSAHGSHGHLRSANNEAEVLKQPADLVLKIPLDPD